MIGWITFVLWGPPFRAVPTKDRAILLQWNEGYRQEHEQHLWQQGRLTLDNKDSSEQSLKSKKCTWTVLTNKTKRSGSKTNRESWNSSVTRFIRNEFVKKQPIDCSNDRVGRPASCRDIYHRRLRKLRSPKSTQQEPHWVISTCHRVLDVFSQPWIASMEGIQGFLVSLSASIHGSLNNNCWLTS